MFPRPLKLFAAAGGLLLVLLLARGLPLLGYEPERSDNYVWGAFHVHSTLSDGLLPLEGIAAQAREARVGFVLLSEHGKPHPEAAVLQETIDGVRFIGGSEVGLPEGHLIVSDVSRVPKYTLPPFPPDAVADTSEWGGISIVTYPEDPEHRWMYWEEDFQPHGIEIVNVTSYFRASSFWQKLDWAIFSMFSRHYYVSAFEAPSYALARWDELLERAPVVAFYAANAHGGFPLSEEHTVEVPSYATAFSYAGLGIERRYEHAPAEAIRRGEFFSIIRAAGEPERFDLRVEDEMIWARLEVKSLAARLDLKENGRLVASTRGSELRYRVSPAGIYRVEAYLENHPLLADDVPWILSNPVYVGVVFPEVPSHSLECASIEPLPLEKLAVEKDEESEAILEERFGGVALRYRLAQATPEEVDRWVALAFRAPLNLERTRGVRLVASSSETMRYWVEVRAGERGHYASFKVEPGPPRPAIVPWEQFYRTFGGREPIPLSEIDAVFVTVNTSNSRTGFSSELVLNELGWCR